MGDSCNHRWIGAYFIHQLKWNKNRSVIVCKEILISQHCPFSKTSRRTHHVHWRWSVCWCCTNHHHRWSNSSLSYFVRCSSHTLCRYKTDQSKCDYSGLVTMYVSCVSVFSKIKIQYGSRHFVMWLLHRLLQYVYKQSFCFEAEHFTEDDEPGPSTLFSSISH